MESKADEKATVVDVINCGRDRVAGVKEGDAGIEVRREGGAVGNGERWI